MCVVLEFILVGDVYSALTIVNRRMLQQQISLSLHDKISMQHEAMNEKLMAFNQLLRGYKSELDILAPSYA
jgi:hypothetical protein